LTGGSSYRITGWDRIYRKEFWVRKEDAARFSELGAVTAVTYRWTSLS